MATSERKDRATTCEIFKYVSPKLRALEAFVRILIKPSELCLNSATPLKQLVFDEAEAHRPLTVPAGFSQKWLQFNIHLRLVALILAENKASEF